MPWGARNNPASPRAHPTANAKHDTVRGKPSRSKPILPLEQNCFHSRTPALPSLSVFCLINYRACMIFFFRVKKKKRKKIREECHFLKRPPPPRDRTDLQPHGGFRHRPPPQDPGAARLPRTQMWASPGPPALRWERPNLPRSFHSSVKSITSPLGHPPHPAPSRSGSPGRWEALRPPLHLSSVGRIPGK